MTNDELFDAFIIEFFQNFFINYSTTKIFNNIIKL